MKRIIMVLALLNFPLMTAAQSVTRPDSQTAHIVSAEKLPGSVLRPSSTQSYVTRYTVRIEDMVYVLDSIPTNTLWKIFDPSPEVGKDYEVMKIKGDYVTLLIPGKKHPVKVQFYVRSRSEKKQGKSGTKSGTGRNRGQTGRFLMLA